jgi:hypothetical protein
MKWSFLLYFIAFSCTNSVFGGFAALGKLKKLSPIANIIKKQQKRSIIDIKHMKGFQEQIKDEHKPLSPHNGFILRDTGWLQNFFKWGPKEHSTWSMVANPRHGLFHVLDDTVRATQNKSLPTYSLNSELTGELIGLIETGDIGNAVKMKPFVDKWRQEHKKVTGVRITHERMNAFLNTITQAVKESDQQNAHASYIAKTPQSILWAYLACKGDNKSDLIKALQALDIKTNLLKNPTFLETPEFKKDTFSSKEGCLDFSSGPINKINVVDGMERDPENTTYKFLAQKQKHSLVPPKIYQGEYSYKEQAATPDCVETAMLELVSNLLYDPMTKSYNLNFIPAQAQPPKEVEEFLKKLTPSLVNDKSIRQEWMNLVSGHKFLSYNRVDYELNPRISSIAPLLSYIFGMRISSLQKLGTLFSNRRRTITVTTNKDTQQHDYDNTVIMTIQDPERTNACTVEFNFMKDHAGVNIPLRNNHDTCLPLSVDGEFYKRILSNNKIATEQLIPLIVKDYWPLLKITQKNQGYWTQNFNNPDKRLSVLKDLINATNNDTIYSNKPLLKQLIETIPDDYYFRSQVFKSLYANIFLRSDKDFINILKSYREEEKNRFLETIMKNSPCISDVRYLVEDIGANPNVSRDALLYAKEEIQDYLLAQGAKIDRELIEKAIYESNHTTVKRLLEVSASRNELPLLFNKDHSIEEPLLILACRLSTRDNMMYRIIGILISHGANIYETWRRSGKYPNTVLQVAVRRGSSDIVKVLLDTWYKDGCPQNGFIDRETISLARNSSEPRIAELLKQALEDGSKSTLERWKNKAMNWWLS